VTKNFALFGKVNNIFDTNYNSFGVYGMQPAYWSDYNDGRFVSPGAQERLDWRTLDYVNLFN